ncbi:MAG: PEP-CTERM sorting domain-containing protein, partial [Phycisphaerales bacterium]|nr:PEP-CTERM sorting domain-containing protein [Phycisphaerales bacterium]
DDARAILWDNGILYDLNDLIPADSGWELMYANDITSDGQIFGYGIFNGQYHAFLLTPISIVPEPATLPVLALATLALVRRRSRS